MKNLRTYWRYFLYILQHKWFVFVECLKISQPLHGLTHDLSKFLPSKFLPSEFFPCAQKFFAGDYAYKYFEVENNFDLAWLHHQRRNKHHWDYWVNSGGKPAPMPDKYIMQMIADWRAMGRKFGDTAEDYFQKNKDQMILHSETIKVIELAFFLREK